MKRNKIKPIVIALGAGTRCEHVGQSSVLASATRHLNFGATVDRRQQSDFRLGWFLHGNIEGSIFSAEIDAKATIYGKPGT